MARRKPPSGNVLVPEVWIRDTRKRLERMAREFKQISKDLDRFAEIYRQAVLELEEAWATNGPKTLH